MIDIISKQKRSEMMRNINASNTKPEVIVRKGLHKLGFRFRLHAKNLPGKPDIVLPKYKTVIEVRGCFWHRHECRLFKWPKSRVEFWREKLDANVARDQKNMLALQTQNWTVLEIWECELKNRPAKEIYDVIAELAHKILTARDADSTNSNTN